MTLRGLAGLLVVAASTMVAEAHATDLPTSSLPLAAGTAAVVPCDGDGLDFRYTVNASGEVTAVTVVNVHASCAGGTLRITLTSNGADIGAGALVLPAESPWTGAYTVTLSPTPQSSSVTSTFVAIEGP